MDAPDARTVEIQPEELAELQPVRRHLPDEHRTTTVAAGEQVEQTYQWTWADRAEWALCFVGPVVGIAAALGLVAWVAYKS